MGQMLQVYNSLLTVYSMHMFCERAVACQKSTELTACLTRQLRTSSNRMLGRRKELSESTKLRNAAAVQEKQGNLWEAMSHEDENKRHEESREPGHRDKRQIF